MNRKLSWTLARPKHFSCIRELFNYFFCSVHYFRKVQNFITATRKCGESVRERKLLTWSLNESPLLSDVGLFLLFQVFRNKNIFLYKSGWWTLFGEHFQLLKVFEYFEKNHGKVCLNSTDLFDSHPYKELLLSYLCNRKLFKGGHESSLAHPNLYSPCERRKSFRKNGHESRW